MEKNYGTDKAFLAQYLRLIELKVGEQRVLLTPDLQGRVLTSTANGEKGYSYGWLNYNLIASGHPLPHCNNYGGEDRFWLGPEGGQYSIFFPGGSDFSFDHWQTPAVIDTEAWETTGVSERRASFSQTAVLTNYAGRTLSCRLERQVELLEGGELEQSLGVALPQGVPAVAFRSENRLTNTGSFAWDRQTGMPSIWILGQFIPSEENTIIIPLKPSSQARINDAYFGQIGHERLSEQAHVLYFKGDGKKRGKIGTPPEITIPVCAALDRANGTLTIIRFSFNPEATEYVNSMWEHQAEPFRGDVINSYNDGPLEDGSIMGPFYEIESSSPAARLNPGETLVHTHTTFHVKGEIALLEQILLRAVLQRAG